MDAIRLPASPRLTFRTWTPADQDLAWGLWGDPQVTAWIGGPFDAAAVQARLETELELQRERGLQYWPVFLADGEHVGCCGLRPYEQEQGYELGFHLRPMYWGRGLATEAAQAVIDHAFEQLNVTALHAGHHPHNPASKQLLLKLGFRYSHHALYPPTGLQHPWYSLAR